MAVSYPDTPGVSRYFDVSIYVSHITTHVHNTYIFIYTYLHMYITMYIYVYIRDGYNSLTSDIFQIISPNV